MGESETKPVQYAYSFDQEHMHGMFASREDAAGEAFAAEPDSGDVVYTYLVVDADIAKFVPCADDILERMIDQSIDERPDCGEAEDWLTNVPKEAEAELEARLVEVISEWATKHQQHPRWFTGVDEVAHQRAEVEYG
ncbi:MAG TPA: hypothetical protein VFZ61_03585 [Polyangiales bacterium]